MATKKVNQDSKPKKQKEVHEVCKRNQKLITDLITNIPETAKWTNLKKFSIVKLDPASTDFKQTSEYFNNMGLSFVDNHLSLDQFFKIVSIERIENPELLAGHLLKRKQLEEKKPKKTVRTHTMFHATNRSICEKIGREGFDWRLAGSKNGTHWGHGISLSRLPHFTIGFTKKENGVYSVLMCQMLQRQTLCGVQRLKIPENKYESTCSDNLKVFVIYDDCFVYPEYIFTLKVTEFGRDFQKGEQFFEFMMYMLSLAS